MICRRNSRRKRRCKAAADAALTEKFNAWNLRTVDLPGVYFMQTAEWIFRENRLARGCFEALGRPVSLSAVKAPIFVLAAEDDEVVSLPQALAPRSLCRRTRVETRIAPGRHLSLFMGRKTVAGAWRDIAGWLAASGRARRSRSWGPRKAPREESVPLACFTPARFAGQADGALTAP